jgi:plastocyanin
VNSAPDTVLVRANALPVADAGPDQQVMVGSTVTLDGTGSSDPDGGPISYEWAFTSTPNGSGATLQNATTAGPSFVPDAPGDYSVQLTVTDSANASAIDFVTITASSLATLPPTVTLQPADVTVQAGEMSTFTAAASGTPAPAAKWQVSTDGGGTFTDVAGATSATLSFATTPQDNGKKFRLVFSNVAGTATTSAATLTVTVTAIDELVLVSDEAILNAAPLMAPLTNRIVDADTLVQFTAVAVDPGDTVTFTLMGAPAGAAINPATGAFTWTPTEAQAPGSYRFTIVATDGGGLTAEQPLTITVRPFTHSFDEAVLVSDDVMLNGAPALTPFANLTVDADTLVQFTAVAVDPGDTVTFTLMGAPAGAAINPATGTFTWTPTEAQAPGSYRFTVVATDSGGLTAEQPITITVPPFVHLFEESITVTDTADVTALPIVTLTAPVPDASESGPIPATFRFARTGDISAGLAVS